MDPSAACGSASQIADDVAAHRVLVQAGLPQAPAGWLAIMHASIELTGAVMVVEQ